MISTVCPMTRSTPITDTHRWLEAIDQHPETTNIDLLAAYAALGVPTDQEPDETSDAWCRLFRLGLCSVDYEDGLDGRWTISPRVPVAA